MYKKTIFLRCFPHFLGKKTGDSISAISKQLNKHSLGKFPNDDTCRD